MCTEEVRCHGRLLYFFQPPCDFFVFQYILESGQHSDLATIFDTFSSLKTLQDALKYLPLKYIDDTHVACQDI